eukprot:gnl/Dysnectes_brevis/1702_a1935_3154.p1 GENE.gnl/Dysnectes_brevis/1702_a1935_3154~~gnl/Dysnectes_brevis/1702_a1935_3154.p1  ORF type:complete len:152 (-),score=8.35 gnl/Dysnectes_brevis/1702_a1935_3154:37-492(-)
MFAARLNRELKNLRREAEALKGSGLVVETVGDSLGHWRIILRGASDTFYDGHVYHVDVRVPDTYPLEPPKAKFITRIFHPNIDFRTGEICLDILKDEWTPAWTLKSIGQALQALLSAPNPDSPLNCDAANMLRDDDYRAFLSVVNYYHHEK